MNIKRLCYLLHLWIGLATGIIVFVVSITGAIYLFKDEISSTYQPWKRWRQGISLFSNLPS